MSRRADTFDYITAQAFILDARTALGEGTRLLQSSDPDYHAKIAAYLGNATCQFVIRDTRIEATFRAGVDFGFETTRPRLGGVAWYLTCNGCGKRCRKLYVAKDRPLLACRLCFRLTYSKRRADAAALRRVGNRLREIDEILGERS